VYHCHITLAQIGKIVCCADPRVNIPQFSLVDQPHEPIMRGHCVAGLFLSLPE
jgi:hypothetical protein